MATRVGMKMPERKKQAEAAVMAAPAEIPVPAPEAPEKPERKSRPRKKEKAEE